MYIIVLKAKYNWSFLITNFNFLTIHQFQNALSKFNGLTLLQTDFPFRYIHSDSKAQEFQTPVAKVCYRFRIPEAKISRVRNLEKTLKGVRAMTSVSLSVLFLLQFIYR